MPNRVLHDSARTSPTLAQLSLAALAMFPNLMLVADDFGFFDADPRVLLANCFPMRSDHVSRTDIEKWRDEMVSAGLIALYGHEDHVYGYFVKWSKWSKPHNTSKRKFPEPNGDSLFAPVQRKLRKSTKDSLGFTRSHSGSLDLTQVHSVSPSEVEVEGEGTTSFSARSAPEAAEVSTPKQKHVRSEASRGTSEAHEANLAPVWPSPEALVALYDATAPPGVPRVKKLARWLTPERLKKIRQYLKAFPDREYWLEAFQEIGRSAFLSGRRPPSEGRATSFKVDLDWFLQKGKDGIENIAKTWDGKYRDAAAPGAEMPHIWSCSACGTTHKGTEAQFQAKACLKGVA